KNTVQYQAFDFKIIQTEHFEVYYYPAERTAALDAARMAERWYARLSRILHHQFQGRKPIILYASQSDFQQTNITDVFEGLQGSTDFFKHRMVLPFTGSYAEFEHVIGHEMVHQFQFDVISRGRIGAGVQTLVNANLPLWFMEGMAEYLSIGPIDPLTSMTLRDASLEGHLPTIEEMTYDPRIFPYHFGHALLAYFGEKNSFFVDLYLADAETGRVKRRLVKSTLNSNYESLRFINSAGSFSPDGRYFAIAAKRKDRDDLVILDVKKDEEVRRIRVP